MVLTSTGVSAEPRVTVSIGPLHALAADLMQGVAEPILLYDRDPDVDAALDPFQQARIITSDILIWTGPGLESSLAQTLDRMPVLRNKLLTLSKQLLTTHRRQP
jgi:zinc transport system substrate-binding protein